MYQQILLLGLSLVFLLANCSILPRKQNSVPKQYVILKLDDLWHEGEVVHPGWIQVMDFLNAEKITGTIGIVGNSLETDNQEYFAWIQQRHKEGHEIWHHGFCHCRHTTEGVEIREYRGESLEAQCESIVKTQQLALEKLGIRLRSFGAPYNSTDESTAIALAKIPDLKVWMYKETQASTDKFVLNRIKEVNIEYPVHNPDFEQFKMGYAKNQSEPILIIQGHPRSWTKDLNRFENFKQIIFFLKAQKVQFVTPYGYYLLKT